MQPPLNTNGAYVEEWTPQRCTRAYRGFMVLIQPRTIDTQVLRPYTFQFDESMVKEMIHHRTQLREAVGRNPRMDSSVLNRAVLPSAGRQAVPILMDTISTKWTFSLLIDYQEAEGTTRQISAGYFSDEPISPQTIGTVSPVFNPMAMMIFTTSSCIFIQKAHTPRGFHQTTAVQAAVDYTPSNLPLLTPQKTDLYFSDPAQIMGQSCMTPADGCIISAYHNLAVSNQDKRLRGTSNIEKSPRSQLRNVVAAIEATDEAVNLREPVFGQMNVDPYFSHSQESYLSHVANELSSSTCADGWTITSDKLDTSVSLSIQKFVQQFPDMEFRVCNVRSQSWDVRPQTIDNAQNVMSYLIAQMISSVAVNCGLSEVGFRHNSWLSADPMAQKGVREIQRVATLVEMSDAGIRSAVNTFMKILECDLFPIILTTLGNFDLQAYYNVSGQTLIQLHLLDFSDGNDGTYEHYNTLNGMTVPNVATSETLDAKATQLRELCMSMGAVTLGDPDTIYQGPAVMPGMYDPAMFDESPMSGFDISTESDHDDESLLMTIMQDTPSHVKQPVTGPPVPISTDPTINTKEFHAWR